MDTKMIAPCGMNCAICIGHLREKDKCPGCLYEGNTKPYHCTVCSIKTCPEQKGTYCFLCHKYPCARLTQLDVRYRSKYCMSMIENLNMIRNFGMKKFASSQDKKWACKKCGAVLSCHRYECVSCGERTGITYQGPGIEELQEQAELYLDTLCFKIPNRCVGQKGNVMASEYFDHTLKSLGWNVKKQMFSCIAWKEEKAVLKSGKKVFKARVSPYSLEFSGERELICASNLKELENVDARGKILLLHGELAAEQLMPKNFVFYNPDSHKKIYSILESKQPMAIITATGRNAELSGGVYPFPMIEDGDFNIPSVYMKDTDGKILVRPAGEKIELSFKSKRLPAQGWNSSGIKGKGLKKIVVCAHIDAKEFTPGALDNGTGVVVLMLLAELMKDYKGNNALEIVALNGEDYFAASGQMEYLKRNKARMKDIALAVNMDGAGYKGEKICFSFYGVKKEKQNAIKKVLQKYKGIIQGKEWYQGDHMIFSMNKVPAMAITSANFEELCQKITHTKKDVPSLADPALLVEIAMALRDVIKAI